MDQLLAAFIELDRTAALAVNGLSGIRSVDLFIYIISFLGNALVAFAAAVPFLVKPTRRETARVLVLLAVALAVGGAASQSIKFSIPRDRPAADSKIGNKVNDLSGGLKRNAFPSGHTATAFGTAAFLAAEAGTAAGVASFAVAAAVGFARIYQGAHFPLDVAAGAIIGIASSLLVIYIARRFSRRM